MPQEFPYSSPDGSAGGAEIALNALEGESAVAELGRRRVSTKRYSPEPLELETLNRLIAETSALRSKTGRPYASAHARYDVTITVCAAAVSGLGQGVYRYQSSDHTLFRVAEGDHRPGVAVGTLDAEWLEDCPLVLLLSADLAAANEVFNEQGPGRGERFCWFEAGLLAQNVYLWSAENNLGTVFIGGLDSQRMAQAAESLMAPSHTVLGLLPVGILAE